jgi:hypothetical protein
LKRPTLVEVVVRLRERAGRLEVFRGPEKIAVHELASGRHQTVRLNEHHADIPLAFAGART